MLNYLVEQHEAGASHKQLKFLRDLGVEAGPWMTKQEASLAIKEALGEGDKGDIRQRLQVAEEEINELRRENRQYRLENSRLLSELNEMVPIAGPYSDLGLHVEAERKIVDIVFHLLIENADKETLWRLRKARMKIYELRGWKD